MSSCRCGAKFSFENARKLPAPEGWQAQEVWFCGLCNLIHHAVQEKPQVIRGPANTTALLGASGRSTGIHYLTWATPNGQAQTIEYYTYPRKIPMTHPEPLLFSLWELLQSKMPLVMEDIDPWSHADMERWKEQQAVKAQARGVAEALSILMKPFVESADDVVRHAVAYYKDPTYDVPGLGTHLWDPMYNSDGTLRTPISKPAAIRPRTTIKAPVKPTANTLSEADIAFCRASAEMFTPEDLASMFKVSVEVVQAVLA